MQMYQQTALYGHTHDNISLMRQQSQDQEADECYMVIH